MIIYCGGDSFQVTGAEPGGFFSFVAAFMIFVIPPAIGYALWRIFVTNRSGRRRTTILGLDENSATYTEVYDQGISWRTLFLYGLTGVVFAFEAFRYLVDSLST